MIRTCFVVGVVCALSVFGAPSEDAGMGAAVCPNLKDPAVEYRFAQLLLKPEGAVSFRPAVVTETGDFLTKVKVDFYVRSVELMDESRGLMTLQMIFRQRWNDPRLAFQNRPEICDGTNVTETSILIPQSMRDSIWTPDLFIQGQVGPVQQYSLFRPNSMIRVTGNGNVLLSQRISLTLACPDLLEKNECPMQIESYAHKANEVTIEWREKDPIYQKTPMKVPSGHGLSSSDASPLTRLVKIQPLRCDSVSPAGTYSCINAQFTFE